MATLEHMNRMFGETSHLYDSLNTGENLRNGLHDFIDIILSQRDARTPIQCPDIPMEFEKTGGVPADAEVVSYVDNMVTIRTTHEARPREPIGVVEVSTINSIDLKTLIHDYTYKIFTLDTDMAIGERILRLGDPDDHYTPDLIVWANARTCLVFEFSTQMADNATNMRILFHEKRLKYHKMLKTRAERLRRTTLNEPKFQLYYIVIICSHLRVFTNFAMPRRLVNTLCNRFLTARSISGLAMDAGLTIPEQADVAAINKADALLSSIEPRFDAPNVVRGMKESMFQNLEASDRDRNLAFECYKQSFDLARRDKLADTLKSPADKSRELKIVIDEYKLAVGGQRTDLKAIVQMPFIQVKPTGNFDHERVGMRIDDKTSGNHMKRLWNQVLEADSLGLIKGDEYNEDDIVEFAMRNYDPVGGSEEKKRRQEYRRVAVKMDDVCKIELAKLGVGKKKLRGDQRVIDYVAEKKECFSWDAPTNDIDDFMNFCADEDFLIEQRRPQHLDNTVELLNSAVNLHPRVEADWTAANSFLCTKFYNIITWWSHVGIELTLSLQQNCREDSFIYKKLRHYPIGVLIKPTKANGPIYFSLMFPDLDKDNWLDNKCFRKLVDCGNYHCTEFASYNRSRLINLVRLPHLLLALYPEWMAYDNRNILEDEPTIEVWRMMGLSLLVAAEDKAPTEEVFTQFRYIFMEKFVPKFATPNMKKILDRLPSHYRSRLALWAAKKLLRTCHEPQYQAVNEDGAGKWYGMRNPYTGAVVRDPQVLLTLSYIGYLKFKSETSEANSDIQLITKMVESQCSMLESNPAYFGESNRFNTEYRFGEFSRAQVLVCAEIYKKEASKSLGPRWREILDRDIKYALGKQTWNDYATLKASSIYEPIDSMSMVDTRTVITRRAKCISVVMSNYPTLPDEPISYIKDCLLTCENLGGIKADIFKKNQHGGTREIMVLSMESKILQKTIEIISRKLCNLLQYETLTHPKNKIKLPQEHSVKMNILKKEKVTYNLSSSCDAKNWNHCHHVNKFALLLCAILPKQYHNIIIRILRLWRNKKIKFPDGLMNLLLTKPETELTSPVYNIIRDSWIGRTTVDWVPRRSNFMRIEAGMLQGILHYTSSLMHACFLKVRDNHFKRQFAEMQLGANVLTLDLVSSDDSARIIEVIVARDRPIEAAALICSLDADCMKYYCRTMGIIESNKSTHNLPNILEFNSEYLFGPNLYRPRIKWIEAAINITESEGFVERQQIMSNTLTELLESGAPSLMVHIVQFAQGLLHYSALGSSVNKAYRTYSLELNDKKDPCLGYFLMDHPYAAGYLGFKYNYWNVIRYCKAMEKQMSFYLKDAELSTTSSGVIGRVCNILFGGREIWIKLLRLAELSMPNWKELISADPSVLYGVRDDKESNGINIMVKLTSPSVSLSLSSGTSLARVMAAAVYAINHPAVTLNNAWISSDSHDDNSYKKASLMKLIREDHGAYVDLSLAQWETMFPSSGEYETIRRMLESYTGKHFIPKLSDRRLRSTVLVFTGVDQDHCTLFKACKWKWFDRAFPSSSSQRDDIWRHYKGTFPWLRDNIEETLTASPFDTHIQLSNFISSELKTRRMVRLTAAPIASAYMHDHLREAIEENIWIRTKINTGRASFLSAGTQTVKSLTTHLASLGELEIGDELMRENLENIFEAHDLTWSTNVLSTNRRHRALTAFKRFFSFKANNQLQEVYINNRQMFQSSRLMIDLLNAKSGVVGGFARRQRAVMTNNSISWRGAGIWVGEINGIKLRVRIQDNIMSDIDTDNHQALFAEQATLVKFIKEMKWTHSNVSEGNAVLVYSDERLHSDLRIFGTPIKETANIQTVVDANNLPLNYEIESGNLRLFSMDPVDFKKVTILNIRFFQTDKISPSDCNRVRYTTDLARRWFDDVPILPEEFQRILRWPDEGPLAEDEANELEAWKRVAKHVLTYHFPELNEGTVIRNEHFVTEPEQAGPTEEELEDMRAITDQVLQTYISANVDDEVQETATSLVLGVRALIRETTLSQMSEATEGLVESLCPAIRDELPSLLDMCARDDIFNTMSVCSTIQVSSMTSKLFRHYIRNIETTLDPRMISKLCSFRASSNDERIEGFSLYRDDFERIFDRGFDEIERPNVVPYRITVRPPRGQGWRNRPE